MVKFAEQEFKLNQGSNKGTLRQELESVWRQTGNKPKELLDLVELPESCQDIWGVFLSLHNSRSYGMSMNPISYSDIKAFFDLYGIKPESWEVQAIRLLDVTVMNVLMEKQSKNSKSKQSK